jgi:hypothetical protein
MNSVLNNNWLLSFDSIVFLLTPIALIINLAIVRNQPNNYKQKIGYYYGIIWAIAFMVYLTIFIF